jgi:hypothetical protein
MKLTQQQIEKIEWRLDLKAGSTLQELAADLANRSDGPRTIRAKLHKEADEFFTKARRTEGRRDIDSDKIDGLMEKYNALVKQGNTEFRAALVELQRSYEPVIHQYLKSRYGEPVRVDSETVVYGDALLYDIKTGHFKRRRTSDEMAETLRNLPIPINK